MSDNMVENLRIHAVPAAPQTTKAWTAGTVTAGRVAIDASCSRDDRPGRLRSRLTDQGDRLSHLLCHLGWGRRHANIYPVRGGAGQAYRCGHKVSSRPGS